MANNLSNARKKKKNSEIISLVRIKLNWADPLPLAV
jgi:hypothetical protein